MAKAEPLVIKLIIQGEKKLKPTEARLNKIKDLVKKILQEIGEDPSREGLKNTPERVEKSLKFLTSGYWVNLEELVNGALFQEDYDEMVIVKDIDLFSMCEHHMLPFIGKCHVAYLPKGKIIVLGLVSSKTPETQTQQDIIQKIEEAAKFIDIEQLALSPQCGFASTVAGNPISLEDQKAKLAMVVEVAEKIWG